MNFRAKFNSLDILFLSLSAAILIMLRFWPYYRYCWVFDCRLVLKYAIAVVPQFSISALHYLRLSYARIATLFRRNDGVCAYYTSFGLFIMSVVHSNEWEWTRAEYWQQNGSPYIDIGVCMHVMYMNICVCYI